MGVAQGQAADEEDENEVGAVLRVFHGDALFLFEDLLFEVANETTAATTSMPGQNGMARSRIALFGLSRGLLKRKK